MIKIFLIYLFFLIPINCYEEIFPLEYKEVILNEENRYIIYEFDNKVEGTIYTCFMNGIESYTSVTVYYDKTKININVTEKQLKDFNEQGYLYNTFLQFKSYIGKMYFIISNFEVDFKDKMHIINMIFFF